MPCMVSSRRSARGIVLCHVGALASFRPSSEARSPIPLSQSLSFRAAPQPVVGSPPWCGLNTAGAARQPASPFTVREGSGRVRLPSASGGFGRVREGPGYLLVLLYYTTSYRIRRVREGSEGSEGSGEGSASGARAPREVRTPLLLLP